VAWGSAVNKDLGGKIRVSVVGTGVEAEVGAQPLPAKVFSFPARQGSATPAAAPAEAEDLIETEAETETEVTAEDDEDELLLGADDILTSPVSSAPIAPPEDDEATDTPTASGGTLFERMSNIARGAPKAQLDDEDEASYK